MAYKNIKDLLVDVTKFPAAIEAKLPAGAPALSTMLVDAATKAPAVPDFPIEIPEVPAPPELPALELPGAPAELRRYVTGARVTPAVGAAVVAPAPAPPIRVKPGLVPFVYE